MLWSGANVEPAERNQREQKATLLLDAMQGMALDALAPGDGDLAFGLPFLLDGAKSRALPYVSANLQGADGALLFPASRLVARGGHKVGITSVFSGDVGTSGAVVGDPVPALQKAIEDLRTKDGADVVVVLAHVSKPLEDELAQRVPGIDLMVLGHSRAMHPTVPSVNGVPTLSAGSRGKHLGQAVLRFTPGGKGFSDPGAAADVERQRQQLQGQIERYEAQKAKVPDDRGRERMEKTIAFTRKRLESLSVPQAPTGPTHQLSHRAVEMNLAIPDATEMKARVDRTLEALGPMPDDHHGHDHGKGDGERQRLKDTGDFAGATACRSCHSAQYEDWQKQGHARAYPTLVREKRHMDLDCWRCHVTGAGQPGGPTGPGDVGMLRNVQCEACHGPSKPHVQNPSQHKPVRSPPESTCRTCHDSKQDGGRFDPKAYRERIDHK